MGWRLGFERSQKSADMFNLSISTLPVLFLGVLLGALVMFAVANELGKRSRLSLGGRLLMAGAIGFGVISIGIKSIILLTFTHDGGSNLELANRFANELVDRELANQPRKTAGFFRRRSDFDSRVWIALPEHAPTPKDNVASPKKIALGKSLFNDTDLSLDRTLSCASCHRLADGGDDNEPVSTGVGGKKGNRNAPTVLNAAFLDKLFWDGRASSLEEQATGPLLNPVEMALPDAAALVERVKKSRKYRNRFTEVFGGSDPVSVQNISKAIAAYERTLLVTDTPYDRFVRGDQDAMSASAQRGMILFDEIGCRNCHADPMFSAAGKERNRGNYRMFPVHKGSPYIQRYELLVDGKPKVWRVPSLRNVALTAPYFHNGSVGTLEEAVRVMASAQLGKIISNNPEDDYSITEISRDGERPGLEMQMIKNRALNDGEIRDLVAFLKTLSKGKESL